VNPRHLGQGAARWARVLVVVFGVAALILIPAATAVSVGTLACTAACGAVALIGLLPGQSPPGWIVPALAVAAFLQTLALWAAASDPNWPSTAVLVLGAVQSLAALAALHGDEHRHLHATDASAQAAYARLVTAYQDYQDYLDFQPQPMSAIDLDVTGSGEAFASASIDDAGQSYQALRDRYTEHLNGAGAQRWAAEAGGPPAPRVAAPGVADAGRGVPPTDSLRRESFEHNRVEGY
jgi:hypothetical protein